MRNVLNIFAQSPFGPIQEHSKRVQECVKLVKPLMQAVIDDDLQKVEDLAHEISELEHEADKVKNDIRDHLPKSLFLPVSRRDLLEILSIQDALADTSQDIGEFFLLRMQKLPEALYQPMLEYVDSVEDACNQAEAVVGQLDELLETSFSGVEARRVLDMITELGYLEHQTDVKGKQLAKLLYQQESEMDPVTTMRWSRLIRYIGELANIAERMGNRLRLIIAS